MSTTPAFSSVYVTLPNEETAKKMAKDLVERKLIACANIFPTVTSVYRWDGEVKAEKEVVMFCKTRTELVSDVIGRVRKGHPYDCPCIVALPIHDLFRPYGEWIEQETHSD